MRVAICSASAALAGLLAGVQPAVASDGDKYVDVCVSNAQGIRVTLDRNVVGGPEELVDTEGQYEARINGREALRVSLCGKNPVLFTYQVADLVSTPLPDAAAVEQFVAAMKVATGLMGASAPTVADRALAPVCEARVLESVAGIRVNELSASVTTLAGLYSEIPTRIELTHDPKDARLRDAKTTLAEQLTKARLVRSLASPLSQYAISRMTRAPMTLEFRSGGELSSVVMRDGVYRSPLTDAACAMQDADVVNASLRALDIAAVERNNVFAMLDTAEAFSAAFQGVGADEPVRVIRYDRAARQSQPITIGRNTAFAKLYSPATRQFVDDPTRTGNATINVEPQLALRLSIAPGAIYSFVRQPKFSATADGAGGFTITQQQSDYTAAAGVVALNITRDKYMKENVRPFVQVGIAPKDDELAFLLGLGIALDESNQTVISMGAIYQERQTLGGGQAVGAALANEDDLKLDTEFKFGFYVGLSYNLNAGK